MAALRILFPSPKILFYYTTTLAIILILVANILERVQLSVLILAIQIICDSN